MQRPIQKPIGTPVDELDTPALMVDIERLDANISALAGVARRQGKLRIQAWVHKTPAIARRQLEGLGVRGIAVRSIAEAEAFAAAGFDDIRILRPVVTARSFARIASLTPSARIVLDDDGPLWGAECLDGAVAVSARVTSVPEAGMAIHDCGQKAIGRDFGDPRIVDRDDCTVSAGSAEHGIVHLHDHAPPLAIGDWLRLAPADVATVFALHDFVYGVRGGVLEAVWQVSARGAF